MCRSYVLYKVYYIYMKLITTQFKKFCTEKFGSDGLKVYKFYTKLYFPSGSETFGSTKKIVTLTEKRIKNITYLLDKYGKEAFLEGIERHNKANIAGVLPTFSIAYFMKIVENVAKEINCTTHKKSSNVVVTTNTLPMIETKVAVPAVYKKVRNNYDDNFYNYNYICTCGQELTPWDSACPKCKSILDWSKVELWF